MTELMSSELKAAGIDLDVALERFMGNDNLFKRFLGKFLSDPNYEKLKLSLETGDKDGALTASHTLKGVCGNLSMNTLFDLFTRQVNAMRNDDWQTAVDMMPEISRAYNITVEVINSFV